MKTIWDEEIHTLERRLEKVRKYRELVLDAMEKIKIGAVIIDEQSGKEMIVNGLKNGCNDFEADPVDGKGAGRGYSYTVRNWRIKE